MLSMNYKILAILFGGLIFFVLFFSVSANIKVNALNKQESIILIIKNILKMKNMIMQSYTLNSFFQIKKLFRVNI